MSDPILDAGALRHRMTIESAVGASDGAGGESIVWNAVASVWARIRPLDETERIIAGHVTGVVTHTVTMRHRADIAGGMRIVYRGRVFRVLVASDPDETRRFTIARVEEETP
ncbi:phage head closure protein [Bauldia sp.]|uniref:phage head closure protein n=1 Tax=Bauldia sp. TaxID=2575872 RepID=UPI003BA9FABC